MLRGLLLAVLGALALGSAPAAQLDLPGRGAGKEQEPIEPGTSRGNLDLPAARRPAVGPATAGGAPPAAGELGPAAPALALPGEEPYPADPSGAARFVMDRLLTVGDPDGTVALAAVASLGSLGEAGLAAAREGLESPRPAVLVTAARVLARHGTGEDRARLVARLRRPLPAGAAEPALAALVDADPVLGSPRLLVELLAHPTGALRSAAERRLVPLLASEHVPLLAVHLGSDRPDTRLSAVQLAGRLGADPAARRLLVDRLGDPAAKVARAAAGHLAAAAADPALVEELLARVEGAAFEHGAPLPGRGAAYALLAIVEREDLWSEVHLEDEHVAVLLTWLRAPDELVAGAAASALAGIGFRSTRSREMGWLDREVPHQLVRLVSGAVFHRDFSALRDPAQRRLGLLTGLSFGSDGPAWQRWWAGAAEGFHARRAVLAVEPQDVPALSVALVDPSAPGTGVRLSGPRAAEEAHPQLFPGERYHLSHAQCEELLLVLRAEGVLGLERLPSGGAPGLPSRVLDVVLGPQGKRFEARGASLEPWLARVAGAVEELARRNRWQAFHDLERYPDRRAFWEEEHAWWDEPHDELERALRRKQHVLACLETSETAARLAPLEELARLYDVAGVPAPEDLGPLLALLREERDAGPRLSVLTGLALRSSAGPDGLLPAPAAAELLAVLAGGLGRAAEEDLVRVLGASGEEAVLQAARGADPLLRAVSARVLASLPGAPDAPGEAARAELLRLFADPVPSVELEAVRAAGEARLEAARGELLARARLGRGEVRAEALRALGRLGGDEAREVLVLALAESEPAIQRAALDGLAELGDPRTAHLLASVFARGPGSPLFETARAALLALGDAAVPALSRLSLSPATETRREAALLLARQGVAEAASTLLRILTEDPLDATVAAELAVLSGVDHRGEDDPAEAWWSWWDLVVHDDALAWILGAAEAEGLRAPPRAVFDGPPTEEAALFFLELLELPALHLQERARRELSRLLGRELGEPPARGAARAAWLEGLREDVRRELGGKPG